MPDSLWPAPLARKRKQEADDDMDSSDDVPALSYSAETPSSASSSPPVPLPATGIRRPLLAKRIRTQDTQSDDQIHQRILAAQQLQSSLPPNLADALANLDKPDLLSILNSLIRSNPHLAPQVGALLPRPTIQSTSSLLSTLEKRLADSFPYTRFGQDRSDYSFNRVRPALAELKQSLFHYLLHFTNPASYPDAARHEFPATSMAYLNIAATIAHRLPRWDNPDRNSEFRDEVYDRVGRAFRETVAEISRLVADGKVFGAGTVSEWGKTIASHSDQVGGAHGFREAVYEFKASLGWLVGLFPSDREVAEYNYANGQADASVPLSRSNGGDNNALGNNGNDVFSVGGQGVAVGGLSGFAGTMGAPAQFANHPVLAGRTIFGFGGV
ncbi:Tethering factor for nuclear proteasome sts1 [Gonapodya sp. JEL0774]|nr:Tethering factor for nuclear proteasome sts1 [Gonapodya sp. JEL0774]